MRYIPDSLDAADALDPQRSLALDWQQLHPPAGGPYSVVATLPPQAPTHAVRQAVAYCAGCSGFSGALASAMLAQLGSDTSDGGMDGAGAGGTVVFIFEGTQLSGAVPAAGGARRLRQAPLPLPANCSLQLGGQKLSFQGCLDVITQPPTTYQVFYTLEPSAGGGTLWRGGLRVDAAAVGGQWAGYVRFGGQG